MYQNGNPPQLVMTAAPHKYPNGAFKDKPCRTCGIVFSPQAPSHLNCSQECADASITSAYLKRNYGITLACYRNMLKAQNNVCAICGGEGFTMAAHHKVKLVVDHDHRTGVVRGLLCHNCNRALGLLKDSPLTLNNAVKYLEKCNDYPVRE